jgi:hypothetical protein
MSPLESMMGDEDTVKPKGIIQLQSDRIQELEELGRELYPYISHMGNCDYQTIGLKCNCGLKELLEKAKEKGIS